MTKTHKRAATVGTIAALIFLLVWAFNWNMLRGMVERRVEQATGRSFHIRGDLEVKLSWHPRITLHDVQLGNAPWSPEPYMLSLQRADVTLDLRSIFREVIVIPHLQLQQPRLLLEKNARGVANWDFPQRQGKGKTVEVQRLDIDQGLLDYRSPAEKTHVTVQLGSSRSSQRPMFAIAAKGRYQDMPTEVQGAVGAITALVDLKKAYPIQLAGFVGKTRFQARGTVNNPLQLEGLAVTFELAGRNMADLYQLVGVPLPPSPPYSLSGRLLHSAQQWNLKSFAGKVGNSDLGGQFLVDRAKKPQFVRATLHSRNLDMKDLSGFVGARDEAGKKVVPAGDRILPDEPFNLEKLRAADMDIRYKARRIMTRKLPLDDLSAHLRVDGGRLRFEPLNFGVAGGDISATLDMNADVSPMVTRADITVRRIHLKQLFEGLQFEKVSTGVIGGKARFAVNGNSVADMLGSANGQLGLIMDGGSISMLALRLANLDVANTLLVLLSGDRSVPIQCMVADLEARNGVMQVKTMVLDTDKEVIHGSGSINFKDESLDLELKADPKDVSLVALRGPIKVGGRFNSPTVRPDVGRAVGRAAVAVVLGAVAAPLALIPLIEPGNAEDSNCGKLIRASQRKVDKPVAAAKKQLPKKQGAGSTGKN